MFNRLDAVYPTTARRLGRRARLARRPARWGWAVGLCLCLLLPGAVQAAERVLEVGREALREGQASQERIDEMSDEAARLLHRYRTVTAQADSLTLYNDNLEKITHSQKEEIASLEGQLASISETRREIVPFKLRMLATLEGFVQRDLPFLSAERQGRLEGLQGLMERADVTVAEKFRRLMEAYQQEIEYGRTIETYAGELREDNGARSVEFLRIGRLAYLYQTPDRREIGFWHPHQRQWQALTGEYRQSLRRGIQVADGQVAPELIKIPVVVSPPRPPADDELTPEVQP